MSNSRRLTIGQNIDSGESGGGSISTSNYMTILALENGLTASLSTNACQYCIDGDGNWIDLPAGTTTQSVNSGQTLSFKGNLTPASYKGIGTFTINKKCNLEGNCMSLLFGADAANNNSLSGKNYAFYRLFSGCTTIIQVSETFLPATTLARNCYESMFRSCTNLTTAPELPATTLDSWCYYCMFYDCSKLTTAPELPATTLVERCYNAMFQHCTNLTTAPELPATTLDSWCYYEMFSNCSKLTTAPELPATTLAANCYYYMFSGCRKLTTSPALPATTLASSCYYGMFSNTNILPDCSNIDFTSNTVVSSGGLKGLFSSTKVTDNDLYNILPINPETDNYWLPATTLASYCYESMFQGCSGLTTAPELPATTLANNCYSYMFSNCSKLTTAPELPATTLVERCYNMMFFNCRNLNYIKMLATDISANNSLTNWVYDVSSTGTFVKNPDMTSLSTGRDGIPSGWTVYNDGEEPGGNLITFTINGYELQAEDGMTWEEWVNSAYNTAEIYVSGRYVSTGTHLNIQKDNINVLATDILLNNMSYTAGGNQ